MSQQLAFHDKISLAEAKDQRKQAELDAQLLANRIALLRVKRLLTSVHCWHLHAFSRYFLVDALALSTWAGTVTLFFQQEDVKARKRVEQLLQKTRVLDEVRQRERQRQQEREKVKRGLIYSTPSTLRTVSKYLRK